MGHIAFFGLDPASRHAAAQALGLTTGALYGSARIAKALADAYRPGEPHRARLNMVEDRKVLTVSYAGEGTYVATLTDDDTVPNPCDVIRRERIGTYFAQVLDRETSEVEEW